MTQFNCLLEIRMAAINVKFVAFQLNIGKLFVQFKFEVSMIFNVLYSIVICLGDSINGRYQSAKHRLISCN